MKLLGQYVVALVVFLAAFYVVTRFAYFLSDLSRIVRQH